MTVENSALGFVKEMKSEIFNEFRSPIGSPWGKLQVKDLDEDHEKTDLHSAADCTAFNHGLQPDTANQYSPPHASVPLLRLVTQFPRLQNTPR